MPGKTTAWTLFIAAILLLAVAACSTDMVRPASTPEYRDWRHGQSR